MKTPTENHAPWRCRQGHILGYVKRSHGSHGHHVLVLDMDAINIRVSQMAIHVTCAQCGADRTWQIAQPSLAPINASVH